MAGDAVDNFTAQPWQILATWTDFYQNSFEVLKSIDQIDVFLGAHKNPNLRIAVPLCGGITRLSDRGFLHIVDLQSGNGRQGISSSWRHQSSQRASQVHIGSQIQCFGGKTQWRIWPLRRSLPAFDGLMLRSRVSWMQNQGASSMLSFLRNCAARDENFVKMNWNWNTIILKKFSSLTPEVVITSGVVITSVGKYREMITFPFQRGYTP